MEMNWERNYDTGLKDKVYMELVDLCMPSNFVFEEWHSEPFDEFEFSNFVKSSGTRAIRNQRDAILRVDENASMLRKAIENRTMKRHVYEALARKKVDIATLVHHTPGTIYDVLNSYNLDSMMLALKDGEFQIHNRHISFGGMNYNSKVLDYLDKKGKLDWKETKYYWPC